MREHIDPIVKRLLDAPYGHDIRRDDAGNSHVTLYGDRKTHIVTIVAPTFDEAVTRALDIADDMCRPTTPTRGSHE